MKNESVDQFETRSRIHMGLAVKELQRSIAFYQTLLGVAPSKIRAGYAKFEVAQPPLNLTLNAVGGETGPNNSVAHFGIQVKMAAEVQAMAQRLEDAGLETTLEESVTCCYAVQDKVWACDPDGNNWEVYVVLNSDAAQHQSSRDDCCQGDGLDGKPDSDCCAQMAPACCCS